MSLLPIAPTPLELPAAFFSDAGEGVADVCRHVESMQRELDGLRRQTADRAADLDRLRDDARRLGDELRLAGRVQREMLPASMPAVGRARFAALWRPAGHVSGDLYDVARLDERHVGVYLADAIGHGVPAALLTVFLKHALVTKEITGGGSGGYRLLPPGEAMARLNDAVVSRGLSAAAFATAVYGVVETDTLACRFASAGHPTPLLLPGDGGPPRDAWADGANGEVADGAMLGVFAGEAYPERTVTLAPGDRLLLHTDGAEVAYAETSPASLRRWRGEVAARRSMPTAALLEAFAADAEGVRAGREMMDDLTVVAVEPDPPTDPASRS